MKILFIYKSGELGLDTNGGALMTTRNANFLMHLYGESNVCCFGITEGKGRQIIKRYVLKQWEPARFEKQKIEEQIRLGYNVLYVDYRFGGRFFYKLKQKYSNIIILKYFHDVYTKELMFNSLPRFKIRGNCQIKFGIFRDAQIKSNKYMCRCADYLIALHERDAGLLKEQYDRVADFMLPISYPAPNPVDVFEKSEDMPIALLVGPLTHAPNKQALYFMRNIIDKTGYMLYVVGKCTSEDKAEFERENIKMLGFQKDVAQYYNQANVVVAPLFSGSGMKTKICEALSYGKTILGTTEAFVGYDFDYDKVGALCNNKDEFISAMLKYKDCGKVNEYSLQIFEEKYSDDVAYESFKKNMSNLLGDPDNDHNKDTV